MKQTRSLSDPSVPVSAILACAGLLGICAPAGAQTTTLTLPPVLGMAGCDNTYAPVSTLVASFSLDANPTGVTLWGNAVYTTAASEVLSGARSVRLSGPTALLEIKPDGLTLTPGEIYALEYDYRIVNDAGAVSVMSVLARWGASSQVYSDPIGLRPPVFGASGTQRRQFRFGSGGSPTFQLAPASNATVIVDNIRVWHLGAEAVLPEPAILNLGFPRLADYNFDSPSAGAAFNGLPASTYEDVLGRFDLVNGVQIDHTLGDSSWVDRMRARNPGILLLPYRIAYSAQHIEDNAPMGGAAGLQQLYNRAIPPEWLMRGPDGLPLYDQFFDGNIQLDPTGYCPRIDGLVFAEFMDKFIGETALPSGLWDGVHFDQSEWFPNPLLGQSINGPLPPIDMNRDGVADTNAQLFTTMRATFNSYFSRVRARFGSSRVLFGNAGRIPLAPSLLKGLSGWQHEIFTPYEILATGEWDTSRSGQWHDFVRNYLCANLYTPAPQAICVQFTGRGLGTPNGLYTGHGYPNRSVSLESRDFGRMRLGLTTTLLGNGFFGYDLVDNTTPPVWFDEYAIDAIGRPTTSLSGKGYLGQPIAAAAEITRTGPVLLDTGFEQGLPSGVWFGAGAVRTTQSSEVIDGAASVRVQSVNPGDYLVFQTNPASIVLTPGKVYDLSATVRVLEYHPQAYTLLLAMGITDDPADPDAYGQSYAFHQDMDGPGQTFTMRTQVRIDKPGANAHIYFGDRGVVALDTVRLSEVRGGAFRRDFEGGIALVNPTPEPVTLTQAEIAGPLDRAGIRRISGAQDPAVNNGQAVTSGLTIGPGDGIVLLADRVTAPAPTAPINLAGVPSSDSSAVDLSWTTTGTGVRAGHLIQYRISGSPSWDRFALAGPTGAHRLEFLDPGTPYEVRVAALDFRGGRSAFTDPVRITTPGAAPVRARIASIDSMVRSRFATVSGDSLASATQSLSGTLPVEFAGTRVTVNGVPARLFGVSPNLITFEVPASVGIGTTVVRVFRGAVASAGVFAQVFESDIPRCLGDVNGDDRTDASDFMLLAGAYGEEVPPGTGGDLDTDGTVTILDLNILANSFGCGS